MKLISHRGNVEKKKRSLENTVNYVDCALSLGFDVEIDVWYHGGFYLGHDTPKNKVRLDYLNNSRFWIHAKNGLALYELIRIKNFKANVFWHTNEDWVLTSKKIIWTFPNKALFPKSVCVLPEKGYKGDIKSCYGICSDEIIKYKNL
tara:strand:- start:436 stop:876 length:441 start_codon:yes stop_codon:yes gene_type:complete